MILSVRSGEPPPPLPPIRPNRGTADPFNEQLPIIQQREAVCVTCDAWVGVCGELWPAYKINPPCPSRLATARIAWIVIAADPETMCLRGLWPV